MAHRVLSNFARVCLTALFGGVLGLPVPGVAREADRVPVGTVTLLIGQARMVRADGSSPVLRQGAEVFVGDRVETGANGHVHLSFVDRGAVSVRPDSLLEVQSYRFDPARPDANEVRLRVERGTARSISGEALSGDKNRFRMNTPIAAIGVRGTDFIVQSSRDAVRVVVAEGAVSVAPWSAGCRAEALGPCASEGARQLSALDPGTMVEVRRGETTARLAPALSALRPVAQLNHRTGGAADAAVSGGEAAARAEALAAARPSLDARSVTNDRSAADRLGIAALVAPATPDPQSLAGGQLVWGHWTSEKPAFTGIALPFEQASAQRHVTVGDDDGALFRAGPRPSTSLVEPVRGTYLSAVSGSFDLKLSSAQAIYRLGDQTEAAAVLGGALSLNFGERRFATALALSSPTGGLAELRAAGRIQPDGIFNVRDEEQRVSGALTPDGKEAGYLFERVAGNGGVFSGRTLWRKP